MQAASDVLSFVSSVIEDQGGLVERSGDTLQAILPAAFAAELGVEEEVQLNGPEYPLLLGSALVDRFIGAVTADVPVALTRLEIPYLKKAGFENLLGSDITFYNCSSDVTGRAEVRAQYLVLWAHYVALSDERKEGLVRTAVHEQSAVFVEGLAEGLSRFDVASYPPTAIPPVFSAPPARKAIAMAMSAAEKAAREELQSFIVSMERRLWRDIRNLREYYQALAKEMSDSLSRPNLGEEQKRERLAKIDDLPRECERKIEDACQKYRLEVRLTPCACLRLNCDAVRVILNVRHCALTRQTHLTWNPVTQRLDPLACEECGETIRDVYPLAEKQSLRLVCLRCRQAAEAESRRRR